MENKKKNVGPSAAWVLQWLVVFVQQQEGVFFN